VKPLLDAIFVPRLLRNGFLAHCSHPSLELEPIREKDPIPCVRLLSEPTENRMVREDYTVYEPLCAGLRALYRNTYQYTLALHDA
jgi:hypothetical protein